MKQVSQSIPEEIIIEFLLRLPVNTLLRFKSVCKTWYNLIKSDMFISWHHNFGTVSQLLLCTNKREEELGSNNVFSFHSNDKLMSKLSPDLRIPFTYDFFVWVVGSCSGIVCYYFFSGIFLTNPATRELKQLPPSSFELVVFRPRPRPHPTGIGFGFESSNFYDFKVLRILCVDEVIRAEMFTLSSNSWRQLHWSLDHQLLISDSRGVGLFCANSFNFIMRDPKHVASVIVCCDIRTERFKIMEFPPKPEGEEGSFKELMAFKGCLSLIYQPYCEEEPTAIWVMKDYGVVKSWTKFYNINIRSRVFPLCFSMNDQDLLLEQFRPRKPLSLHLSTLDIDDIHISGYQLFNPVQVVVHKESLVSIRDSVILPALFKLH